MKTKLLNFRTDERLIKQLQKTSKRLDVPYSQIVREAIKEKLDRLDRENAESKKAVLAAQPVLTM